MPAVGVKLTVQGALERMTSHWVIPRTAMPPTPCVFASAAGVVHVIVYGCPTLRFTLLFPVPLQTEAGDWHTNVHFVLFVVVAEIVTAIGAADATTTSFVALLPPAALSTKSADL